MAVPKKNYNQIRRTLCFCCRLLLAADDVDADQPYYKFIREKPVREFHTTKKSVRKKTYNEIKNVYKNKSAKNAEEINSPYSIHHIQFSEKEPKM